MNTRRLINRESDSEVASVVLVCTACQHTWEPNLLNPTDRSETASMRCPLCDGWTWIGEITEPGSAQRPTAKPSTTRSTPR